MIEVSNKTNEDLANALNSGDKDQASKALAAWAKSIEDRCHADYENYQATQDQSILARRGIHTLTNEETKFYNALTQNIREKKAFDAASVVASLPITIIEDVIGKIKQDHPLIAALNPTLTTAVVDTISDASAAQLAVWGDITEEIKTEITASLKEDKQTTKKLSCYLLLSEDYLELGPQWLDAYVREVLEEALACGVENGAINGNGLKSPIGMIKDIHDGVTVSTTTGYPDKTAQAVTSFDPKAYGALLATMATKENGRARTFTKVYLVCNPTDYLTKIMPATTVMNALGNYVGGVFPFPTEVLPSTQMAAGKAVIFAEKEYKFNIGTPTNGNLTLSDDYKFLEDFRAYKLKMFGNGKCKDNTSAIYLDISGLTQGYVPVKEIATA